MSERWVNVKKLSTINYLRALPRTPQTEELRTNLLNDHKENKKEFKEFIKEYRKTGYWNAIKRRRGLL